MSLYLERLLEIDALIRSNTCQAAESLAKAVEKSDRTIRDDIAFLRDRYQESSRRVERLFQCFRYDLFSLFLSPFGYESAT